MNNGSRWYGNTLLTITAIIWGLAFVAQSAGMKYVGPFTFQCVRCALGGIVVFPLMVRRLRKPSYSAEGSVGAGQRPSGRITREMFIGGLFCGLAFTSAAVLQQFAMVTTDAGKAAFITALYIVLVPVLGIFLGEKVKMRIWGCVLLCILGVWFISVSGQAKMQRTDFLLLGCAVLFAVQIQLVNYYVKRIDGVWISFMQLATSVAVTLVPMLVLERPTFDMIVDARYPILYAGILSCGIAYTLQIIGQKYTSPVSAGLIMSMECVFGMLGGVMLLHQIPSGREVFGCVLVFTAVILSQVEIKEIIKRKAA
ncbi:MAG: DMT family transporter [Lachnospiraceae bacterium]|nr:DMT family transporter [Lachnospiraceae bacterium]